MCCQCDVRKLLQRVFRGSVDDASVPSGDAHTTQCHLPERPCIYGVGDNLSV